MKNTRHFTLFALRANDAHSYIAEKRNSPPSCNLILPSIWWFTLRALLILLFLFSISLLLLYLFSFYSISEKNVVLFHLSCCVFFSHEYIFCVKHFQFLLVIFRYLIQGGIWNTQALLSHIVFLILSLTTVIECGFPSLPEPHIQTYARHFHMYTQKKKQNTTCQTGAHPLTSALTPLAHCHLPKPHPPLTHFSLKPHTETKDEFWGIFIWVLHCSFITAGLICTKRQAWW